jgi:hypothetical protein
MTSMRVLGTKLFFCGLLLVGLANGAAGASLAVTLDRELPPLLRWALDVRWSGDGAVYLAGGKAGVFELSVTSPDAHPSVIFDSSKRGFFFDSGIAVDGKRLITSAWAGGAVKDLSRNEPPQPFAFAALLALDARAGKIVILGADRDEQGRWAPEGALAWLGDVGKEVTNLRPVLFSTSPGVKTVAFCSDLHLGAVRFVDDASFVIVPGVEPGVYWYGIDGKLKRTWQTSNLGFYDHCALDEQQHMLITSYAGQAAWYNRNVVLDALVILPDGIGLVLRKWERHRVHWTMQVLRFDDRAPVTVTLPFESPSPYTHLRSDSRGAMLALLFVEYGPLDKPPARPPRLVIARYKP